MAIIDESNGYDRIAEVYIKGRGEAVNGIGSSTARAQNNPPGL
jgi:hypothetical protein